MTEILSNVWCEACNPATTVDVGKVEKIVNEKKKQSRRSTPEK